MDTAAFKKAYKMLNTEQKRAVDTIDGPVLVVAGPGTGKTQILTLRIANILLQTDIAPENILALTFTESGARAMRERLRGYIGSRAYRVPIYTFHGFADRLIQMYPEYYERVVGGRAIGDIERIECITTILEGSTFQYLRPIGNPQFYTTAIIQAIADMKREYLDPDAFADRTTEQERTLAGMDRYHEKGAHKGKERSDYQKYARSIGKNRELLFVYRAYEAALREINRYDYEDMIVETVRALEAHEDFLRDLQETYQYVLADEHQDVNGSQNHILELLASYHTQPNLFVVGDEKQAIYRFQGASLENFLFFEERFPQTTTIALTQNYRSGQTILDGAHSLITSQPSPAAELRVPLSAEVVSSSAIAERHFSHQAIEDAWLVEAVHALDAPRTEIAVIVRTNREVEYIAGRLRQAGIPVRASAESDILGHPIMHEIRALLTAVSTPSDAAIAHVLHGTYWRIPPDDLVRILAARRSNRSLSKILQDATIRSSLELANTETVERVSSVLTATRKKTAILPPHRVLEYLLEESSYLQEVLDTDVTESVRVVRRIYDEVERMVTAGEAATIADVVRMLDTRIAYGLPLNAPFIDEASDAVTVMTAHKSKGLEFGHVFIPRLTDRSWGGARRAKQFDIPLTRSVDADAFDALDDERRLLYVALTRAKEAVYLSYADTNADGRGFLPSRLRAEIDEGHISIEATDAEESAFDPVAELTGAARTPRVTPALIRSLFLERGLSATALNNYLESPWQYIYRNILRIPEVQPPHLQYGTAVHAVLQRMSEYARKNEGQAPITEVKTWLDHALGALPLSDQEHTSLHEKGLAALSVYADTVTFSQYAREELRVSVMMPTGDADMPEIPLTGMLDRIDLSADGTAIRVIDYKTGKAKTRGQIEGTTKDSDGGYKRQLVFYALLLSLYDDAQYATREATLSFIEPDSRGRIREESFTITDTEIEELRAEIIRIAREVTTGAFLTVPCDPTTCDHCDLVTKLFDVEVVRD